MKQLTKLALPAVAALALAAFLGAGSASATVLCAKYESPCLAANTYGAGTSVKFALEAGTSTTFKTTASENLVTCEAISLSTKVKNAGGKEKRVEGELSSLALAGCSSPTTVSALGQFTIEYAPQIPINTRAYLWASNLEIQFTVFGVACTYGGLESYVGTLTSTTPAKLHIKTLLAKTAGGFLCPADVTWEGAGQASAPEPLYFKEESK
ncbi:MAG TPA: hypothetical protein VN733_01325 [Solirubrobacterales bacterium]|nr:hypothetical protein [Solirubrobacterales bacterium]